MRLDPDSDYLHPDIGRFLEDVALWVEDQNPTTRYLAAHQYYLLLQKYRRRMIYMRAAAIKELRGTYKLADVADMLSTGQQTLYNHLHHAKTQGAEARRPPANKETA